MKRKIITNLTALLVAGVSTIAAAADTDTATLLQAEAQRTDTLSARHGSAAVQTRIASEFSAFAGSDANAQSLVTGLRNGTPITLSTVSASSGGATATATTIEPRTRPMGYGNVYISLALAQRQLAAYGISDPTPHEIQAALTGGTITTGNGATAQTVALGGVLNQRAAGMGWGAISRSQGTSLGPVVSGLKNQNFQVESGGTAAGSARITTATGGSAQTQTPTEASARVNSNNAFGSNRGSGIVSGSGTNASGGVAADARVGAHARGLGAGIVTGGAGAVGAPRSGANAQGQAKGSIRH